MSSKSIGKHITIAEHPDAITIVIVRFHCSTDCSEIWFGAWIGLGANWIWCLQLRG